MSLIAPSKGRPSAWLRRRPFYAAFAIASFLILSSYLQAFLSGVHSESAALYPRAGSVECRDVHHAQDVCAFVRANCDDEQPGLVPYLTLYYCTFGYARIAGFVLLLIWLGLLFSTIGIAASDFFTPNLQTIASVLSMPENLTGVTFLAVGNGSPDLFSTVMSMRSNSAAMAVGELIGAASFITAIVAGSIVMISEFKVDKRSFVRDLLFFIFAVCLTLSFLLDGHLHFFECVIMIAYYGFYVLFVSGAHWYSTAQARRAALAENRARAIEAVVEANGEARYEDYPGSTAHDARAQALSIHSARGSTSSMPRIEIEGDRTTEDEEDEGRERGKWIAAEIASNMRVRRPTVSRRPTAAFIRPSLVGALELNSAFEHFRKESRSRPDYLGHLRRHSVQNVPRVARIRSDAPTRPTIAVDPTSPPSRERAHSHTGNVAEVTPHTSEPALPTQVLELRHENNLPGSPSGSLAPSRAASSTKSFQLDGNLAVPPIPPPGARQDYFITTAGSARPSPRLESLHLHIPSRRSSTSEHSDTLSPFPGYVESPMPMSPNSEAGPPSFGLPPPTITSPNWILAEGDGETEIPNRYKWWPYFLLPAPEVIMATLFPMLQNWSEKTFADAFVSVLSVPSFFLLSITLPVVDARGSEIEDASDGSASSATNPPRWQTANDEWELFRRHRRSTIASNRTLGYHSVSPRSPASIDEGMALGVGRLALPKIVRHPDVAFGEADLEEVLTTSDEGAGWTKWQVLLQTLAGPPFSVFIACSVVMEQPTEQVVDAVRWSLVASGVLFLTVLLTTKADQRPRYHSLLCFPGFLVSVSWIAVIAGEVVGVLKAIGVIWSISEAILGLTIFAAGNSVGDWVSDYTIASLGSPVMAFAGCIGGPMLNILLGISTGGLIGMASKARRKKEKHPDRPIVYEPYKIRISGSLVVSAATLLLTLLALLTFVSLNKWVFSRRLGIGLISLWCISTGVNLMIEILGLWTEVST
ncbi:hypothetical protein jhhlp_007428 [Lomentospora prolificans]|uniref:Sodium/calcium exchanger membrane region domain-containing protein n=1 Tax=Lomentospora prolificans TaxID=41688 RepID=A0A2N3N2N2_9PEZI|nr:hypothetical protein jhhlp_007428 [Lomentospora prolificans]